MITPDLQTAASQFLAYFLQPLRRASGGGPLQPAELLQVVNQLGTDLEITLGEYAPFVGAGSYCGGISVPATDALFIHNDTVTVSPGGPDGITLQHQAPNQSHYARKYVLSWLVERADIRFDDQATIARVLRDMDHRSGTGTAAAGGTGGGSQAAVRPSDRIAEALTGMSDRDTYPDRIEDIDSVPAGVGMELGLYREMLRDYFTFDEHNRYYPKWWSSPVGAFPLDTTELYRRLNVQTPFLSGEHVFVLGHVPGDFGLPDHADRQAGEFREFIVAIHPGPAGQPDQLNFDVVNSAVKSVAVNGAPARDYFDFCFFTLNF